MGKGPLGCYFASAGGLANLRPLNCVTVITAGQLGSPGHLPPLHSVFTVGVAIEVGALDGGVISQQLLPRVSKGHGAQGRWPEVRVPAEQSLMRIGLELPGQFGAAGRRVEFGRQSLGFTRLTFTRRHGRLTKSQSSAFR